MNEAETPWTAGYLTLKGLEVYSSCSVRWLRSRLADPVHPLPCYRIGGKVLVKREEFDAWMDRFHTFQKPDELNAIVDEVLAKLTG